MSTRTQQLAITGLGHPARPSQVAVMHAAGAFGLVRTVEAKDDPHHLSPVCALLGGIKQTQIRNEMALVVGCEPWTIRRMVVEVRYSHGLAHQFLHTREAHNGRSAGSNGDAHSASRFAPAPPRPARYCAPKPTRDREQKPSTAGLAGVASGSAKEK